MQAIEIEDVPATDIPENMVTPGGFDTLHVSFRCKHTQRFEKLLHQIRQAQAIAKNPSTAEQGEDAPQPTVQIGSRFYEVQPNGFAPDKKAGNKCYFHYVLKCDGITFALANRSCTTGQAEDELLGDAEPGEIDEKKTPNVRVEVGAMAFIAAASMRDIMEDVESRLRVMGLQFIPGADRVARADLCVDLPFHVAGLQQRIVDRRFITRARAYALYSEATEEQWDEAELIASISPDKGTIQLHHRGMECTGLTIGKDGIMCRAYNKQLQLARNEPMRNALILRRFNGQEPLAYTRVEFQIRREALRGFLVTGRTMGIKHWRELDEHKGAVARYLCMKWLYFTENKENHNHTERLSLDDFAADWIQVVNAFCCAFGPEAAPVRRFIGELKQTAEEAVSQSMGCDQSAIIKRGFELAWDDPDWKHKVALFRYQSCIQHLDDPDKEASFRKNWMDKHRRGMALIPEHAIPVSRPLESTGAGVTHHGPTTAPVTPPGASGSAPYGAPVA